MNSVNQFRFQGITACKNAGYFDLIPMIEAEEKISRCTEHLCSQGCARVSEFIAGLKTGQELPEVAELNTNERQRLLDELVSIMAVYGGKSQC